MVVTLFSINRKADQPGTVLFYREGVSVSNNKAFDIILPDAENAIRQKISAIKKVEVESVSYEALIEYIAPPVALIIAGAGNDVKPLVDTAYLLGWEVTVADGRATHATRQRFPQAKNVYVAKPEELISNVGMDSNTFFVLMTHNYKYDLALLKLLLATNCAYIGILGPKTKLHRMFNDLNNERITVTDEQLKTIYGPVGLEIGAETSEEIAISVVAEIKAVMSGKLGTSLKYKEQKIHTATQVV